MPNIIQQGTDCWIEANNITDVRTGTVLDVTGYSVHAVARARYARQVLGRRLYQHRMNSPVVSEWSTTPTGTQGLITAGGDVPDRVQIHITPAQSSGWRCPLVAIQAEMTDPLTGFVARIVDEVYEVALEVCTF